MKGKDLAMYILAALVTIGFFTLIYLLTSSSIPEANKEALYLLTGALIGSFQMVVSYFFGSSKGSADKTEMLRPKL